ncbi:beta-ketoacyl-[acyl-carrier-protein] synthase family protein [Rhodanobacter sp. 7MK24]|uniref:beta-ketoacyl-[acyl-carrier-protein] synthase family protein n=1 Tax=Rhodanobacter sp. 7MK24 TaxID=2775922 RepID=UPI00177EAA00|nr:beta-ketoacyl-[acyl-carrier-protein] synthase family protein [Rhodanobacter sp. 7MK24]MBD8880044.1 beta-ketoacyl-[acyl-carrier-protein] synthase family protein [Rhodanobacter sp. 7MK24]
MTTPTIPLAISASTVSSALGRGLAAQLAALRQGRTGLRRNDFGSAPQLGWIGRVDGVEAVALPPALADWDCRNNRLAWLGLQQDGFLDRVHDARQRHGARRVALLLGTSTASIGATEEAYRRLDAAGRFPTDLRQPALHAPHSLGAFVAAALALQGPCLTISTACSSSAKVFASAARMIALGLADAAVVGGVDSLCDNVLFGFNALELISPDACRPFDANRDGISLGEAAGFTLLERIDTAPHAPRLLGYGEASDAWHMSSPHPDGHGAELALDAALARAGIHASQVDYLNLHGTASRANDAMEAALVARRFPATTRVSSTKGCTGHTLGAAGIVEATIALQAIEHGFVPGNVGVATPDPACSAQFAWQGEERRVDVALSNSFGFGGNNACLVFGRAP